MLKSKLFPALAIFLVCATACAEDSRPSEKSIRELLEVTEAHKLLDNMRMQMDNNMKAAIQQSLKGQVPTPEQQKILDKMRTKMVALMQRELTWESLEPSYSRIYRDTFTQEEVDGMIDFYRTPAGQAVINKMPAIMQNSVAEIQKKMLPLSPKLKAIEQETQAELQALKKP